MADELSGLTWPADGKQVHQGDLSFEQESKSNELINHIKDILSDGVMNGGAITNGTNAGTIKVAVTIAYISGKRIDIPETDNFAAGVDGTKYAVIRHKFNTTQSMNAQGFPIDHRSNSYEILLKTAPEAGDISLAHLTVAGGVVTTIVDQRTWCLPGSPDRKFKAKTGIAADDVVNNAQMEAAVSVESAIRVSAESNLQTQINALTAGIHVIPYEIKHCTNLDISAFTGLNHNMDLSQPVIFVAGDIVASGFDMKLYTVAIGAWTLLATIANHDAFFIIDTKIYYNASPEGAVDFLFNNAGAFLTLFDMPVLINHANSHASGGSDPITPASIGAEPASSLRLELVGVCKDYTGKNCPAGYVLGSGRTIGDAASGATERANADTLALFTLYYTDFLDAELSLQNSVGAIIPRSTYATALLAFNAHSRITLPDLRGRGTVGKDDMGGTANRVTTAGSGIAGTTMLAAGGVEKYTLNATHLPAHSHTTSVGNDNTDHYHGILADIGSGGSPVVAAFGSNLARAGNYASGGRSAYHQHTVIVNSSTGGDQPHPIMQPCIIVLKIIKL